MQNDLNDFMKILNEDPPCPCKTGTPCKDTCTCGNMFLSGGCEKCASYGSDEQRWEMKIWLLSQRVMENVRDHFNGLEITARMEKKSPTTFDFSGGKQLVVTANGSDMWPLSFESLSDIAIVVGPDSAESELTWMFIHEMFKHLGIEDDLHGPVPE